jgi:hypothetical protein
MRLLLILSIISLNLIGQTKEEIITFHDALIIPYNNLSIKLSEFTGAALKHSPNAILIAKRNAVVVAMKGLNKSLKSVKPLKKDFNLLAEVRKSAAAYDLYIKNNLMIDNLASVPQDARANIRLIRKYQKINKKFQILSGRVIMRQKKLLTFHKFNVTENDQNRKMKMQRKSIDHYYNISVSQFKVQANIDDFIDAYEAKDVAKMRQAKAKGILQIKKAFAETNAVKPFNGDNSIIEDSKKILGFYNTLLTNKFKPMIKMHTYPKKLPNDKVDAFNATIDASNSSLDFYNGLQTVLDASNVASENFFKRHLK